jgi:cob(I)alamin adenosyltransferase
MNISELLATITDECDRREFITAITEANSAINLALDMLPEGVCDSFSVLTRIESDLAEAEYEISNWEKAHPEADTDLANAMKSTFAKYGEVA